MTQQLQYKTKSDGIAKREATVIAEAFAKALVVPRQRSRTDQPIRVRTFEA